MAALTFPTSQKDLLRLARGKRTQREFAQLLGVARTSLSRYESEQLGLPVRALNRCLEELANASGDGRGRAGPKVDDLVNQASRLLDDLRRLA